MTEEQTGEAFEFDEQLHRGREQA